MKEFTPYLNVFGYHQSSLKDYPLKIASVLFFKHCNMACSFCHNLKNMNTLPVFDESQLKLVIKDSIFSLTDAITITGGEPTLQGTMLISLLKYYRKHTKKLIKLDTNGTNPNIINEIITHGLVDFIAMDIKGNFEKYKERFNFIGETAALYKSVELLEKSNVAHEFRTTVFPDFNADDMAFVSQFPNIKLQEYRPITKEG